MACMKRCSTKMPEKIIRLICYLHGSTFEWLQYGLVELYGTRRGTGGANVKCM